MLSVGVPPTIAAMAPAAIAAALGKRLGLFLREITTDDLWVRAPLSDPSRALAIAAVVDAVGAAPVRGIAISALIDSRFDRDLRSAADALVAVDGLLVFNFDDVGDHKKAGPVAESLVGYRRSCGRPTLYVSDANVAKLTGRFGVGVCSYFAGFGHPVRTKSGAEFSSSPREVPS